MKTFNRLPLFFCVLLCTTSWGQAEMESTEPVVQKGFKISDFYVQTSMFDPRLSNGTIADFKELAPNSVLLQKDMAGFTMTGGGYTNSTCFSGTMGIQLGSTNSGNFLSKLQWRIGFSYNTGNEISAGAYFRQRTPYDTLTSSQTGNQTVVYSHESENYGMSYSSEHIRLENSLFYFFNPNDRWSIFTGLGFNYGTSFNNRVAINYSETNYKDGGTDFYANDYSTYSSETYNIANKSSGSIFSAMGLDFRIGNKRDFLKRTHLYYEFRPSIQVSTIHALRTYSTGVLQHGLGLRVSIK